MDPGTLRGWIELAGSIGAPAVAVILSMKYAINGMRQDVKDIKQDVQSIRATVQDHTVEIAIIKHSQGIDR